jgi:environmental stress-induced protein Ves
MKIEQALRKNMMTQRRSFVKLGAAAVALALASERAISWPAENSMPIELIDLKDCPVTKWPNGAGTMQPIATHPHGADTESIEWRISTAEVAREAVFSRFSGIDRCIALLSGRGFHLRDEERGIDHWLDKPFEPFRFPGEASITATPIAGVSENLSVLVRRERVMAEHEVVRVPLTLKPGPAMFLMCVQGTMGLKVEGKDRISLERGQAALWRDGTPQIALEPTTQHAAAIVVRFVRIST